MEEEIHVQVKDNSPSIAAKMEEKIHVQVKDNSPSIERILRPITYTSWLLGVGIARPRKCPKAITIIIRIIHMAVCSYVMISDIKFIFSFPFSSKFMMFIFLYLGYLERMMCYTDTQEPGGIRY